MVQEIGEGQVEEGGCGLHLANMVGSFKAFRKGTGW